MGVTANVSATLLASLALLPACSLVTDSFVTNEFSGDPFPIQVELSSGAVVLGVRQDGVDDRVAILDVLSPLTLVDPGAGAAPSVSTAEVFLLGQDGAGGPLAQPRARLLDAQLVSVHPCGEDVDACVVGPEGAPRPYQAIVGADALAGDAVRLRLGDEQVFLLADIGGDEQRRTKACDAVFPAPYRGGGTLIIGGTELAFGGRRIAIQTCLGPNPDPLQPQALRGADALMVMSTSIGISILGESAYRRYLEAHPTATPFDQLPLASVFLPSGPVDGRRGTIDTLALVATSSSTPRAACRQVYASHFMTTRNCRPDDDCPCEDDSVFCGTPAVVEIAPPAGIDVLVVPDTDPTLQALRTELRPDQAEVDGILGTGALRTSEIDIDYPHNRLLARCSTDGCITRPAVAERPDREQAQGCLEYAPPGPLF